VRPVLVVVGVIILIIGLVLFEVPLLSHPAKTVTLSPPTPIIYNASETIGITATEPVSVSWTSTTPITMEIVTCKSELSSPSTPTGAGCSSVTQTGTSGSSTRAVPVHGSLWVGLNSSNPSSASATVTLKSASPTAGLGLVGLGVLILLIGLALRRPRSPVPASAPQPATSEPVAVGPAPSTTPSVEGNPGDEPPLDRLS
jgi:hypothetical protein